MDTLDHVFGIYHLFMDSVDWRMIETDMVTTLDDGRERAILEFSNGFTLELLNDPNLEEGACMRCWWDNDEENAVAITTLEQLKHEFNR